MSSFIFEILQQDDFLVSTAVSVQNEFYIMDSEPLSLLIADLWLLHLHSPGLLFQMMNVFYHKRMA
jgi:hypothetical protein